MRRFLRIAVPALIALVVIGALWPSVASAASPLALGFNTTVGERSSDFGLAAADGADVVRIDVAWSSVAPESRPSTFVASDPSSQGYDWSAVDAAVRAAAANHLRVALTIYNAPAWAEGNGGAPSSVQPGSWRVNASDFGQFATAAATRYSGSFPDPQNQLEFLPRVQIWQAWNEPNLDYYLSPQWARGSNGHWQPVAPALYRSLLNAFYTAVKRVSPSNRVMMAGTAPYGDPIGSDPLGRERTPPVAFDRDVFCLSVALKPSCSATAQLDGVDHHPYDSPSEGPEWHAANKDDAAYADVYKITRVMRAGVAVGHVLPRGPKTVWTSEIGWSTNPPNSQGVPVAKDARWYEQAFYVLWKQGVTTIMPTEIVDEPVRPYLFQDGLYYANGQPKASMITAYRFPFITQRQKGSTVQAWGRSPAAGKLAIQVQRNGRWTTLRTLSVASHQVFSTTLTLAGSATLRATVGALASLTWRQSG